MRFCLTLKLIVLNRWRVMAGVGEVNCELFADDVREMYSQRF